jgi:hypothetical protein
MNYIKRLEAEAGAKDAKIANALDQINDFLAHLASPKFAGTEVCGSRKDWIAINDVAARLQALRSELL